VDFLTKRTVFKSRTARDEEHTVAGLARVSLDAHISSRHLEMETDF
jgi:hypothetical protein